MIVHWQIRNQTFEYSGMDSPDLCRDKKHFEQYDKPVTYNFNSWGCRDNEPPTELDDVIWCVGDSFTVGLGQPIEETWPKILEKKLNKRCLNVGQDGCPNDMMSIRVDEIKEKYNPNIIIIMWSYFARRLIDGKFLFHEAKTTADDDIDNFIRNLIKANHPYKNCKILNYIIPNAFVDKHGNQVDNTQLTDKINEKLADHEEITFCTVEQLDYSRDGHHFDVLTCEKIVDNILTKY
jgi:hypothetical protein